MDKLELTNILLVDDRPERLLAIQAVLEPLKQNLVPVSSGNAALKELLKSDFSVILLDVRMPGMDGFETARLIRGRPKSSHTPIIFVSGSREWDDMERAYSLGAVDFITVPIVPCVLRSKVAVFVDLYQTAMLGNREAAARLREEHARRESEAANAAKDDFLAMVSHELRTPLAPIFAGLDTLESEAEPEALRQTLHMMRRNLEMEARLLDDLLDISRIQTGRLQMQMETVNVENALARAVEICKQNATQKSVHLEYRRGTVESLVEGDPARLQQVFWNLIHNAIKFTPMGGTVTVRSSNPSPGQIRIDVIDTGIGIDPHHVNRIFKHFIQVPQDAPSSSRKAGLGLGLAISKILIESHGGQIWASSSGIGQGSTFSVQLQVSASAAESPVTAPEQRSNRGNEPLRILLVDDHKDTLEALQRLLIRKGYLVEGAEDVASGIRAASAGRFDLLISDIGLPDGTGIDLVQRLNEKSPLPAIALSGFGMPKDIQSSRDAGFVEHLTKPVSFSQLEAVIRRIQREFLPKR